MLSCEKLKLKISTWISLIFFSSFISAQDNYIVLRNEIDKILKYEYPSDENLPHGYSIAIIDGDSSWILNYGVLPYSDSMIRDKSFFELSGLSKTITSSYLLDLENKSKLQLDQTALIADSSSQNIRENFTWNNFINHRAGIPKFIKKFQVKFRSEPLATIDYTDLVALNLTSTILTPNKFQYSHHNYAFIQWFLHNHFNNSIKSQITSWIHENNIDTLNFNSSLEMISPGVSRIGISSKPSFYKAYWASLGMNANILFMKDFIQRISLPQHRYRILNESRKIFETKIDKRTFIIDGWYGLKLDKNRYIYSHAGRSKRHKVSVQMLPETSTAVIIFCNSELGIPDLGLHILKMLNNNWKRK